MWLHLKFGDGIMSMINCKVLVEKKEDPAGDRVVLTFEYVALRFMNDGLLTHTQWKVLAVFSVVKNVSSLSKHYSVLVLHLKHAPGSSLSARSE
jgi:hypothetical protein